MGAFGDFPDCRPSGECRLRVDQAGADLAEGSLRLLGSPDDVAAMVLGGLEGAMLITRLDGDVARFTAAADRLLNGLVPA